MTDSSQTSPLSVWQRLGSSLAALIEAAAALFRRRPPAESLAFTVGLIALSAKMAKADGVVTRDEVKAFGEIFEVGPGREAQVRLVFDLAKETTLGFDAYARDLARLFGDRHETLEDVLDGLFHIAAADGIVHQGELAYLEEVARIFGFDPRAFASIKARHVRPDARDPYVVLGAHPDMSDAEIRRLWLKLAAEHHPDRLGAHGVPAEFVKLAEERLAAINAAYDEVTGRRVA